MANILKSNVEPYYSADYDEIYLKGALTKELSSYEDATNKYIKQRNEAYVMKAVCLHKIGKNEEALSTVLATLDLLTIKEEALWKRSRLLLDDLI